MKGFLQWRWHLDEMYVKINGEMVYLWRADDQESEILESFVTRKRDKAAALTFMKKALKRKTGARGLRSIIEQALLDTMYELPSAQNVSKVVVDENTITGDGPPILMYSDAPKVAAAQ